MDGTYSVGNLLAGTYTAVAVDTINGLPVRVVSAPFTITNADVVDVDLVLPTAADLTGVSAPPAGQSGLVIIAEDENGAPVNTATATVSGMAGTFGPASTIIIPDVTPVTHSVSVTGNGQTITNPQVNFASNAITVLFVTLPAGPPPVGNSDISGTAELLNGTPVAGITIELWSAGAAIATTTTNDEGNFGFTDVAPGDYSIANVQMLEGFNTVTLSEPFTVTAGVDITGLIVIVPTTDNFVNAAIPSATSGTLIVMGINETNQLVPITIQLDGGTPVGPITNATINNVDLGTPSVAVTASTGTKTIAGVPITANTITVLVVTFPGATP